MSNDRIPATGAAEEVFLARLADVSPVAEETEQVHLAAAIAAVREAGNTAEPSRRTALRPTVPLWRKPRMALSNALAALAALSLPAKAAAATAAAAVAIGGGVAVTNTPPENPPADTPAAEALEDAADNTGFPVPTDGQPVSEEEEFSIEGHDGNADHGVDGEAQAEKARTTDDKGEDFGQETASEASDGKSTEARQRAADARADAEQAEARRQEAEERRAAAEQREAEAREREEAQQREAEAEARADAEERQQARDSNATSGAGSQAGTDEADEQSSTGTDRSGSARTNADSAPGR